MARGSALRVVQDPDVYERHGDESLTREAIESWREGQRRCRARKRHNWGPFTVYEHKHHYEVIEQCSHCRNRRTADFNKQGRKLTDWSPEYRDGYLLPKGATPLRAAEELQDELVLGDILSRRIVEALDDDDD